METAQVFFISTGLAVATLRERLLYGFETTPYAVLNGLARRYTLRS
jgi:hypothetical protein